MTRKTAAIMLQGTGSDVGKSLVVAGLCKFFARKGFRVKPFKPQNMSNNAAVTADGGEIGRAQALQALACGTEPTSDMNPVLLKPESDKGSQVILQGRVWGSSGAMDYQKHRTAFMPAVMESFGRLRDASDLVIVEGAGSVSEVNLRAGDIANMGFAVEAGVPVALVADVDRGGVIASLVGSYALLTPEERALLKGYIINKFRGDLSLFAPAIDVISERTGLTCAGVLPWFSGASKLPAEDSLALSSCESGTTAERGKGKIKIRVLTLSRISNFDDFDPLAAEDDVDFAFVPPGTPLPGDVDLVIIPGTKATLADLAFLRAQGWDVDILAHVRRGGRVLGVCGGYQMLGEELEDPLGIESLHDKYARGLGLLPVKTVIGIGKTLRRFSETTEEGDMIDGYEIHMGVTETASARSMFELGGKPEGAKSTDGKIQGCYIHGLFTSDGYRARFLSSFRRGWAEGAAYGRKVEETLDELADHVEKNLDVELLAKIAGL